MRLGIIGLSQSGKTTFFNAVTRSRAAVGLGTGQQPNVGVVTVPDERVDRLAELYRPKKKTYATIEYVDFPASGEAFGRGRGISGRFLNELARMDGLIAVVRAFRDETVPHPEGSVDPVRDVGLVELELAFADLALLERRIQRLETEVRSLRAGERERPQRLLELLRRMKGELEQEVPIRAQQVDADEWRLLEGSQFLSAKPLLVVINIGEEDLPRREELEASFAQQLRAPHREVAVTCAKFEMELNELSPEEAEAFRQEVGVRESGAAQAIRASYHLLGMISFLTAGPEEVRAWTIPAGATAPEAAGKIHSDLQRGFIRAEVVRFEDLVAAGSEAEARKRGLMRTEGKGYVVQDGDVLHILFNV